MMQYQKLKQKHRERREFQRLNYPWYSLILDLDE